MNKVFPYLALGLAMAMMGSQTVSNKVVVGAFPVFFATEGRLLLSCLLQLALLRVIREPFPRFTRKEWKILFAQAFLGVFLFSICFMVGLKYTSALESGIFSSFIPAAGGLISIFIFREKVRWNQHAGILLTIFGTLFINVAGSMGGAAFSASHLVGNILILLSSFFQAVFVTFGKLLPPRIHFLALGAAVSGLGALMFLPLTIWDLTHTVIAATPFQWSLIFYNGLICTGFGVMLMNYATRRIPAAITSVFTSFTPISAIALSFLLLRDRVAWYHLVGIVVIFTGIGLSLLKPKAPVAREAAE